MILPKPTEEYMLKVAEAWIRQNRHESYQTEQFYNIFIAGMETQYLLHLEEELHNMREKLNIR